MDKTPVIFLDRDGTINEEVNYLYKPEDLYILPGVPEAIAMLRQAGYKILVVTNQAGIARGYYTEQDVVHLHEYLNMQLEKHQAYIDAFYYCPHHPEHGNGVYGTVCSCRKPGIGMFKMAEKQYCIDKERSWMIGDKLIDIEAGRVYGVKTMLVGTGYGKKAHHRLLDSFGTENRNMKIPYDAYAETLLDAAGTIIKWRK